MFFLLIMSTSSFSILSRFPWPWVECNYEESSTWKQLLCNTVQVKTSYSVFWWSHNRLKLKVFILRLVKLWDTCLQSFSFNVLLHSSYFFQIHIVNPNIGCIALNSHFFINCAAISMNSVLLNTEMNFLCGNVQILQYFSQKLGQFLRNNTLHM